MDLVWERSEKPGRLWVERLILSFLFLPALSLLALYFNLLYYDVCQY
jgi:hypothetical protein